MMTLLECQNRNLNGHDIDKDTWITPSDHKSSPSDLWPTHKERDCVSKHSRRTDADTKTSSDGHIQSIIPKNIFSRLYLFFHTKVDCSVIPNILVDLITRKNYNLDVVLDHLREFQDHGRGDSPPDKRVMDQIQSARLFIFMVGKVFDEGLSGSVLDWHIDQLASLVVQDTNCFEELLGDLCRNEESLGKNRTSNRMTMLENCLEKINKGESRTLETVDQRLSCGETPIKLAVRFRSARVLHLLLRYGASVQTRWLCFNSAFEVLLFSPHQVFVNEIQKLKIQKCLEVLLRASEHLNFSKEDRMRQSELVPFIQDWQELLPNDMTKEPCSLKHKCRIVIRSTLHESRNLPGGIYSLPLPNLLKSYLDLVF